MAHPLTEFKQKVFHIANFEVVDPASDYLIYLSKTTDKGWAAALRRLNSSLILS